MAGRSIVLPVWRSPCSMVWAAGTATRRASHRGVADRTWRLSRWLHCNFDLLVHYFRVLQTKAGGRCMIVLVCRIVLVCMIVVCILPVT